MKELSEDKGLIRRYLLGELPEAEQQRIEQRFILEAAYRESVLITEEELIEDYLEGALDEGARHRFATHFLSTPQQRRKVRIAESLKKSGAEEAGAGPTLEGGRPLDEDGRRARGRRLGWRRPLALVPVAAALTVLLVFGAGKLMEMRRTSALREQEQRRHAAVEQELARLNEPAGAEAGQFFRVVLPPVSARSLEQPGSFAPPADASAVELSLVLTGETYPSYRVLLRRPGEAEPLAIRDMRAESTPEGRAVVVRIPAHLLTRGGYQIQLLGVAAGGREEQTGDYSFQITERPST